MRHTAPKKIDIQAKKLYLELAIMNLDSDETSRDIRTGVLHRISIPFIWAEWFSLGSHFRKNAKVFLFSKYACPCFWEQGPKMVSAPNAPTRKEHVNTNIYICIYTFQDTHVHGSGNKVPKWILLQMLQSERSM